MRILTFTTLYPNREQQRHGVFVENRLRELHSTGLASIRVVAPVPWFPLRSNLFGSYSTYARIPGHESRHGIEVLHPRYPVIPKIGMSVAPWLLALSAWPLLGSMLRKGEDFDLIDAHYFYPDGVAAVIIGRLLGKPVVITARGSDLNVIAKHFLPGAMIRWAAGQAAAVITVCRALQDSLLQLGVDRDRITVLRNGVDLDRFRLPADRESLRRKLGFGRVTLLSVGRLVSLKGHDLVIRAVSDLPGVELVIVGEGEERTKLAALVAALGVGDRVRLVGEIPHDDLADYYGAADLLVLASSSEGWANVLLEAMACGTPVVATDVGGAREVVDSPDAGILVASRDPDAIRMAVQEIIRRHIDRNAVRQYASRFDWGATSRGLLDLFSGLRGSAA